MHFIERMSQVAALVGEFAAKWKGGPRVTVVAHAGQLPVSTPDDAVGMCRQGEVFIVARQPLWMVPETMAHEAVAHYGLRVLLRSRWKKFMGALHQGIESRPGRKLKKLGKHVRKAYSDRRGRCRLGAISLADEVAAQEAEAGASWIHGYAPPRAGRRVRFAEVMKKLRRPGKGRVKLGFEHLVAALKAASKQLREKCTSYRDAARRRPGARWRPKFRRGRHLA